jgi:hypothetical protein
MNAPARRWTVIGIIVAVAIAAVMVGAHLRSQPKKGSLEWHKREYQSVRTRLNENRLLDRLRQLYAWITGRKSALSSEERRALQREEDSHEKALLEMGFLAKRRILADGTNSMEVLLRMSSEEGIADFANWRSGGALIFHPQNGVDSFFVDLTAPEENLRKWEQLIRSR